MQHLVCIGHAKCGTTLLDSVFRQSRLVATPFETKEIKFFLPQRFQADGARERYLGMFADSGGDREFVGTFEASPPYSHHPPEVLREVLGNIVRTLDAPRLVVCFRQPVLRAYSHYIHNLHSFALYGEGAFAPRQGLLYKPCVMSFEEALAGTKRLITRYATTLRLACEAVGRERVSLFFLEQDATGLGDWISRHAGHEVAKDLSDAAANAGAVFTRRPLPNYVADGDCLHAFGSLRGEYIRYTGVDPKAMRIALDAREKWTLSLPPEEIARFTEAYYREDLQQCAELTGDRQFLKYLEPVEWGETATLSHPSLLQDLHGMELAGSNLRFE